MWAKGKGAALRRRTNVCAPLLLAVTVTALALPGVASAQSPDPAIAQAGVRTFDIASQPLAEGLIEFARQSGLQVSAETAVVGNRRTPGVRGRMTPDQALGVLLSGTGLVYRLSGSMVIVESAPAPSPSGASGAVQLDPLHVQGFPVPQQAMIDNLPPPYAGGQVATGGQLGLLGNRDVMDTPFNQTSYTAKKAQDQQATTIRDVLIDDPSVRVSSRDGGPAGDQVRSRGFIVSGENAAYGGLYGMLPPQTISVELAERIELLKGPSAMLNGMPPVTSIGGTVNLVPKRAPNDGLTQLTANYSSSSQFGGAVDIGHRFGTDKQFGVRFNGVFKAGQTPVQWNADQRGLASLGLDFRGDRVRLSADLGYQYQYVSGLIPWLSIAAGVPVPWAPDARKNFGQPWNYSEFKDVFGVVRGEVDVTDRITAYAAFGAHDNRVREFISSNTVTITSFDGTATSIPNNFSMYNSYLTAEAGVRALVDTGPISHEFAATATIYRQEVGTGSVTAPAMTTNIYNTMIVAPPDMATPAANKTGTTELTSLGFADTLSAADKRIQLTVGARLQRVQAANFNAATGLQTSGYDQSALSPSVSLVFKPWRNVSLYGNWIQGLQQGVTVGANFTNAGEVFPPYKSTQYEVGVKVDWGKFTTTASAFQITQPSTITNVATNTLTLNGEQRNQGLEFNIFGEPFEGVRVLGGAMLLSPVLAKTQGGLTDGWIAPLSPQVYLNLAGEWDLPYVRGLTLTGRVIYTGSQYIDTTWPRRTVPDWTRFDLGARYAFENPGAKGKLLVARFNVENLLDANYWESPRFVGAPRTFRLSLTADF